LFSFSSLHLDFRVNGRETLESGEADVFCRVLGATIQPPPQHTGGSIVTTLTPRHVEEAESDRRCIKDGWYAMNKAGQVCSGRFSNQEDCQAHIQQAQADSGGIRRADRNN